MESLNCIFSALIQGLLDSIKGIAVIFYLDTEMNKRMTTEIEKQQLEAPKHVSNKKESKSIRMTESNVLKRVVECCLLNGGIFWFSIVVFEYGVLPGLQLLLKMLLGDNSGTVSIIWNWMQPSLSLLFGMIWVVPLFLLSKIVNSLWFQDIADSAFKFRKGRPQLIPSISKLIADTLFSLLVQALFLVQSMIVNLLPIKYLGTMLCFVHICLLYSLYSFEYKWFNMGWELHKRLTYIEYNWPYFLGFGLPLAVLTQLPNSYIISGCVFSILFPLFILSGNEASPKTMTCDLPLKLFSPVVTISNSLFSKSIIPMRCNDIADTNRMLNSQNKKSQINVVPHSHISATRNLRR